MGSGFLGLASLSANASYPSAFATGTASASTSPPCSPTRCAGPAAYFAPGTPREVRRGPDGRGLYEVVGAGVSGSR
ncbi:hypothetical protein ACF09L_33580 [Streptomyces sp. NPDC014779]|uniref:hypothetical protein n=1 Tax=Streptomyces sp. NPDC014779 TaxID=3364911 RepID=UPI0036FC5EE8